MTDWCLIVVVEKLLISVSSTPPLHISRSTLIIFNANYIKLTVERNHEKQLGLYFENRILISPDCLWVKGCKKRTSTTTNKNKWNEQTNDYWSKTAEFRNLGVWLNSNTSSSPNPGPLQEFLSWTVKPTGTRKLILTRSHVKLDGLIFYWAIEIALSVELFRMSH